jgi:hypothetical protein
MSAPGTAASNFSGIGSPLQFGGGSSSGFGGGESF